MTDSPSAIQPGATTVREDLVGAEMAGQNGTWVSDETREKPIQAEAFIHANIQKPAADGVQVLGPTVLGVRRVEGSLTAGTGFEAPEQQPAFHGGEAPGRRRVGGRHVDGGWSKEEAVEVLGNGRRPLMRAGRERRDEEVVG